MSGAAAELSRLSTLLPVHRERGAGELVCPDLTEGAGARARERDCGRARRVLAPFVLPERRGALERFARRTFTQLGYRFSVRRFADFSEYLDVLGKGRRDGPAAGVNGWAADYPAASTFFGAMTCAAAADHGFGELLALLLTRVRPALRAHGHCRRRIRTLP